MAKIWRSVVVFTIFINVFFGVSSVNNRSSAQSAWSQTDIGAPATPGRVSISGSSFTMTAAGFGIARQSDKFFFVYQPVVGDVEIRARVDGLTVAKQGAKTGVMIRGALTGSAAMGATLVIDNDGTAFPRRPTEGGNVVTASGPQVTAPVWVRLVRTGNTLTSYESTDGTSWQVIGQTTVALPATAYVGLALDSHSNSATATAALSQVTVIRNGVPAGQQAADIGAPAVTGSSSFGNGVYQIHAGGAQIGGVSDQFHYVYQSLGGDADVTVRVGSQTNSNALAQAGVMFRAGLAADASNVSLLLTPSSGYLFQRRPSAGASTTSSSGGTGAAPGWLRIKRTGALFTAYRSADGMTWTVIGSDSIAMADPIYVGIAAASHSTTVASDVVADNFAVTAVQPMDLPPSVSLTTPSAGESFIAPASIAITATASDPENQLSHVDFYNGSTMLGSDAVAPYSFSWSNVAAGTYSITAIARDAAGLTAQSSPVTITVSATLAPPTGVMFRASLDHATLTSYRVEVFTAGVDPGTTAAIATIDVGKPTPDAANDITVSIASLFQPLAPGNYQLTVAAVNGTEFTRSTPVAFTK